MTGPRILAALCAAFVFSAAAIAQEPQMRVRDRIDLSQGPDAPVTMTVETTLRGAEAERLREALGELGHHGLAAEYEAFYDQIFGEARMVQPIEVTDEDGVLTISELVVLPSPYTREAGSDSYAFDFLAYAMRPVARETAGGSIETSYPFHTRHETIVILPGTEGDSSLPEESLNIANAAFNFAFEAGPRAGNIYLMAFELRTNAASAPAADAADIMRDQRQVEELAFWGLDMDANAAAAAAGAAD